MRAHHLLLSAALTLCGSAAFAQSSYNVVVEPVSQSIDAIINAPIEYDDNGVVQAQHFNADDLTDEEYRALLEEADRIRTYRDSNGFNFEDQYVYPETVSSTVSSTVSTTSPSYQIELFAPETNVETVSSTKMHTVSKGDTLYNISKRYDTSVEAIQTENGMFGTTLSIGQRIRIPGMIVESINTVSRPIYAAAPAQESYITRRVVEPAPVMDAPEIEYVSAAEAIYAVLPKDTLYSISRRTCVGVKEIIARNRISNPNALTPGQRITLPVGHCVSR
jgi:LysM repeat protein